MKKILSVMVLAFLIGFTANAQVEIKPTIGLNLSNVNSAPSGTKTTAKTGYQFGGSLMFGDRLYLSPGILYYRQVTRYVIENPNNNSTTLVTSDEKIAGVKIPVLLGYRFIDPSNDPLFNLRLFAGPTVLFNTSNKFSEGVINDEVNWKKNSWGAQLGAGIDVAFLFVEVGYEFGLSNKYEGDSAYENFKDIKHNTFVVNFGLRLVI